MLVQIYDEERGWGATEPWGSKEFEELMKSKFEMSMMEKINYFMGLHIR